MKTSLTISCETSEELLRLATILAQNNHVPTPNLQPKLQYDGIEHARPGEVISANPKSAKKTRAKKTAPKEQAAAVTEFDSGSVEIAPVVDTEQVQPPPDKEALTQTLVDLLRKRYNTDLVAISGVISGYEDAITEQPATRISQLTVEQLAHAISAEEGQSND